MSKSEPLSYFEPTREAGRLFARRDLAGPISVASFLSFASHEGHLAGLGHHTAAITNPRLPPLPETSLSPSPHGTAS